MTTNDYLMRTRALLIEQEKGLTMQRAAIIGQRKAIEALLGLGGEPAPSSETVTLTNSVTYTES